MPVKLFRLFLILLLCVLTLGWTQWWVRRTMLSVKEDTMGKINAVAARELDYNMTVWGASTALVNVNPAILKDSTGYPTMNMGINGTNIDQYHGLLRHYIGYTEQSQWLLLVLDVEGGLLDRDYYYHPHYWIHHLDNPAIYNSFYDIDPAIQRLQYVPFYALTLYDQHAFQYIKRALSNTKEVPTEHLGYKPNGTGYYDLESNNKVSPFTVDLGTRCFEKIISISEEAHAKGIEVAVVVTPCFSAGRDKILNYEAFTEKVEEFKQNNIYVLDFSDHGMSQNPKYFVDNTHLNAEGANVFTRILASRINQMTQ